ncbi:hypothetical protein DFH09DRAFT_1491741 [Mycena vulgaris]|nr:hypothetical protein DFH09DRAFT_1491741 [Mycena vulgaris]
MVEAGALYLVDGILESGDFVICGLTNPMLANLESHEFTAPAVIASNRCRMISDLLCGFRGLSINDFNDDNRSAMGAVALAAANIALSTEGAHTLLQAGMLDLLRNLLQNPGEDMRYYASGLLYNLASFECCVDALLDAKLVTQFASLLTFALPVIQTTSFTVGAVYVLGKLSQWPKAASAIAKTNILDRVPELMESLYSWPL